MKSVKVPQDKQSSKIAYLPFTGFIEAPKPRDQSQGSQADWIAIGLFSIVATAASAFIAGAVAMRQSPAQIEIRQLQAESARLQEIRSQLCK